MFKKSFTAMLFSLLFAVPAYAADIAIPEDAQNFYTSDKVTKQAVTFLNQYKMEIAGKNQIKVEHEIEICQRIWIKT